MEDADKHLLHWQRSGNKIIQNKISELIKSILSTPYSGIGKPESLKYRTFRKVESKNIQIRQISL